MKIFIITSAIICFLSVTGCNKNTENKKPVTEETKKQDQQMFSGAGKKRQNITLKKGLAAIDYSYNHADSLTITILDPGEKIIGVVMNKEGSITGGLERVSIPADGEYILDVKGTGRWIINIW